DFFITDANHLSAFLENSGEISDDRPILEFSTVSLLPPLKWETDEVFLNMLRHRINQKPPVTGMTLQEREAFDRNFKLRTAQRLAVFSRRYQGPGAEAFARRNYFSGLETMSIYFDTYLKPQVHLDDAQWQK
ncbi:MAG TPA: spermine synthase, partial [Nitrospina sp.]|nr:spermine synthase [Nitrospina sp.]